MLASDIYQLTFDSERSVAGFSTEDKTS
jgi:hypothetical protein